MWVMVLLFFCCVAIGLGQISGTVGPPAFSLSTIRVMPRSATLSRDLEEIYSNLSRVPVRRERDPTRASQASANRDLIRLGIVWFVCTCRGVFALQRGHRHGNDC